MTVMGVDTGLEVCPTHMVPANLSLLVKEGLVVHHKGQVVNYCTAPSRQDPMGAQVIVWVSGSSQATYNSGIFMIP